MHASIKSSDIAFYLWLYPFLFWVFVFLVFGYNSNENMVEFRDYSIGKFGTYKVYACSKSQEYEKIWIYIYEIEIYMYVTLVQG